MRYEGRGDVWHTLRHEGRGDVWWGSRVRHAHRLRLWACHPTEIRKARQAELALGAGLTIPLRAEAAILYSFVNRFRKTL